MVWAKNQRAENHSNPPLVVALKILMLVAAELQIQRDGVNCRPPASMQRTSTNVLRNIFANSGINSPV